MLECSAKDFKFFHGALIDILSLIESAVEEIKIFHLVGESQLRIIPRRWCTDVSKINLSWYLMDASHSPNFQDIYIFNSHISIYIYI